MCSSKLVLFTKYQSGEDMEPKRLTEVNIGETSSNPLPHREFDWQIRCNTVSERCRNLLGRRQWTDCKFIVGIESYQEVLEGHKLILAASSPVFEAMFYGGLPETSNPIPILDVQPEAFKALLEYVYTDNIALASFDQACELCYAAKKYMMPHLVEECMKYLWSDLHVKNVCRAYEFAKLFEEPKLMEKCILIMQQQTLYVLKDSSFLDVEIGTILAIFDMNTLAIKSEMCLFNALVAYLNKQNTNSNNSSHSKVPRLDGSSIAEMQCEDEHPTMNERRAPSIRDCLMKIRFLTLTPKQFAEGPGTSNLLTPSEKLALLMHISSSKADQPMPPGFCKNRSLRDGLFDQDRCSQLHSRKSVPCIVLQHCPIIVRNTGILEFSLGFTCRQNVWVYGVEVRAQVTAPVGDWEQEYYSEVLYAHLMDRNESRLTYTHYTGRVKYKSKMEILFDRPVEIAALQYYKVGVVLHKCGDYEAGTVLKNSSVDGVAFEFSHPPTKHTDYHKCLVQALRFSTSPPNDHCMFSTAEYIEAKRLVFGR